MTDKVYIVTSGEYSDYCIRAVFLDEDEAKLYADACGTSTFVEEWEVGINEEVLLKLLDKNKLYTIYIHEFDSKPFYYLSEPGLTGDDTISLGVRGMIVLYRWIRDNDSIDKVVSEISARVKANDIFDKARTLIPNNRHSSIFKLSELFIDI